MEFLKKQQYIPSCIPRDRRSMDEREDETGERVRGDGQAEEREDWGLDERGRDVFVRCVEFGSGHSV